MATKMVSLTRRDRIESNESCSMNFNRVGVVSSLAGYSVAALHNGLLAKILSLTQVLSRPIVAQQAGWVARSSHIVVSIRICLG